jgi:hypothetical protein
MAFSGEHRRSIPPYTLRGGRVYSEWLDRGQDDIVLIEVHWWISGLYWKPWQSPSQPLAALTHAAPLCLRRATIAIDGYAPVTIDYSERPVEKSVRLLRIR